MKLADLYARPGLTLSVEFFPPKTEKGEENLFSEIEIIKRLNPGFCSVTYGAGGSTREKTLDLVEAIHGIGLIVATHNRQFAKKIGRCVELREGRLAGT